MYFVETVNCNEHKNMKENIRLLMLVLMAVLASCSNDNVGTEEDGQTAGDIAPKWEMRCTSFSLDGLELWADIKYDNEGRVVSYERRSLRDTTTYVYTYSSDKIVRSTKHPNGKLYDYEIHSLSPEGLIMKTYDPNRLDKTYDYKDGRLFYCNCYDYDGKISVSIPYTWEDGNLVKQGDGDINRNGNYHMTYYDVANCLPPVQTLSYIGYLIGVDPILAYGGFYGKMPKNLLKSVEWRTEYEVITYNCSYWDVNDGGYPTRCKIGYEQGYFIWEDAW